MRWYFIDDIVPEAETPSVSDTKRRKPQGAVTPKGGGNRQQFGVTDFWRYRPSVPLPFGVTALWRIRRLVFAGSQ